MISANAQKLFLKLLKTPHASLVPAMRSAIDAQRLAKEIDDGGTDALNRVLTVIEAHGVTGPISLSAVLNDWRALRTSGTPDLPVSMVDATAAAVIGKRTAPEDWRLWLETLPTVAEIERMVQLKLLKAKIIGQWAKASPAPFYESGAVDALLNEGVPLPRAVWKRVVPGTPRSGGLMPADEVVAATYAADASLDASQWLVDLLVKSEVFGQNVLRQLLREPRAIRQFASDCALLGVSRRGSVLKGKQAAVEQVARQLIAVAEEAAAAGRASAAVARSALAILATTTAGLRDSLTESCRKELMEAIDTGARSTVKDALLSVETGKPLADGSAPFTVSARGAYDAVQDYLVALGAGVGAGTSGSRAVEHAQLQARRRVVMELLPLTDGALSGAEAAAHVEVALHNLGAVPIGSEGERMEFDPEAHVVVTGTALPGETVKVRMRGWMLRIGETVGVVRPAEVIGITI